MKEITIGIEQGIKGLFESERYRQYLSTTNRFDLYSVINTSNFLTEHNLLDYALLKEKATATTVYHNEPSERIKAAKKRMAKIAVLCTLIINYAKARDTYATCREIGYSRKSSEEHEEEILLHQVAKTPLMI